MEIVDVRIYPCSEWRPMLFCVIETADGRKGIGEAGLTSREMAVAGAIEAVKPLLIGQDARRIDHLWQVCWRSGFHPGGQVLGAAIGALDIALHDLKGQALGVPVYELLGGKSRDHVLTYCHIKGATPDDVVAAAHVAVSEGWRCLRWELFDEGGGLFDPVKSVNRNILEWRLLRESLGDAVELCVDLHTKLDAPEAVRLCRAVEPYRPMFIEDPLRSEHPEGYRRLRQQTAVPIAAGEQAGSKWDLIQLIEEELVDVVRLDLCIGGGLTEGRKIAAMAEAHMLPLAIHNPIGPISTMAALHLNTAIPNMLVQELPKRPDHCMPKVFKNMPVWSNGTLACPEAPGLGINFDEAAFAEYPYVSTQLPMLHRADGSYTNW